MKMMNRKFQGALVLIGLFFLAGCGPLMGQAMRLSEGVEEFQVTKGSLTDLRPGSPLLVYGPMEKTDKAYYICKGEDDSEFAAAFRDSGLFKPELYLERPFKNVRPTAQRLRGMSAAEIREALHLEILPERILFGTILVREVTVAPARGVIMTVGYRLEFFNIATRQSTVVEVMVRKPAQDCIPAIVEELQRRLIKA